MFLDSKGDMKEDAANNTYEKELLEDIQQLQTDKLETKI